MESDGSEDTQLLSQLYWRLAVAFFSALTIASIGACLWLENHHQQQRSYIEAVSEAYLNTLSHNLMEAFSAANTLGVLVKHHDGELTDFEQIAQEILATTPSLAALQLAPEGIITSTVPLSGNEVALHHDLMDNPEQLPAIQQAMATGRLTVFGPFRLLQGGMGAVARQPVYLKGGQFWGLTTALIRFPDIIQHAGLQQLEREGIAYSLWHQHNQQPHIIFQSGDVVLSAKALTMPVMIPNGEWMLSVEPEEGWYSAEYFTIAGLLGSLFVLITTSIAASVLSQPIRLQRTVEERTQALTESESRFRYFFEKNHCVMMLIDPGTGLITQANDAACQFYGYSIEELHNSHISQINALSEHKLQKERENALTKKKRYFQFVHRLRDQSTRHVDVYSTPIPINGRMQLFSIIHDVTKRHTLESENRLAVNVFTHATEAIVVMDHNRQITSTNAAFSRITGINNDEAMQQLLFKAMYLVNIDEMTVWDAVETHGNWKDSVWGIRPDNSSYAALLTITVVHQQDDTGPPNYIALFSDITNLKTHEKELEDMARLDPLTRLPNRTSFLSKLSQELAEAEKQRSRVAVLFLDLDGFKSINDTYGHQVGDQVLTRIATQLRETLHDKDVIARAGGDEFLLLLPNLTAEDLCSPMLNRLLLAASSSMPHPLDNDHVTLSLSASIGISFFPDHGQHPEQLIRQADHAMYQSKQLGRNCYTYFTETQTPDTHPVSEKIRQLEAAIPKQQLLVYYQPKVDLHTGLVKGYEALVRWQHPERGLLNPVTFVDDIEKHKVFVEMDLWVLKTVFEHLSSWNEKGFRTSVGINVSAKQLQNPMFPKQVQALLEQHPDIKPNQLELEILESSALQDLGSASDTVLEFRAMGIEFALDDFGTGYSTLKRLQRLPVKSLKIDTGFVLDMLHNTSSLRLVKAILALSDAFNLHTVAEGIENQALGVMLIRLGCQYGQGYGIARPMPMEEVMPWQKHWRYPECWRQASIETNGPEEHLLIAEVEHRTWMQSFLRHADSDIARLPEMNSTECNFGQWCQTDGYARYSDHSVFNDLLATHHELHLIARELLGLPAEQRDMQHLEQTSNRLLNLLRLLPFPAPASDE
jgi:diguanylate cyclase (GGDEF)-like protein/PAS domain S-box-containing protein